VLARPLGAAGLVGPLHRVLLDRLAVGMGTARPRSWGNEEPGKAARS
jgi:hypothetical protein